MAVFTEVDADVPDSAQFLIFLGRQGIKNARLIGRGGPHFKFDGVFGVVQVIFLTEPLQIHLLAMEEVIPLADPAGIGAGPLQRPVGEDGAAVEEAGVVHQRGVAAGVGVRAPHVIAVPPVRHRLPGDDPVGGEHGPAEQLGVLHLVCVDVDCHVFCSLLFL